jgi:hypothetical protein
MFFTCCISGNSVVVQRRTRGVCRTVQPACIESNLQSNLYAAQSNMHAAYAAQSNARLDRSSPGCMRHLTSGAG